jgi:hypothetical protein
MPDYMSSATSFLYFINNRIAYPIFPPKIISKAKEIRKPKAKDFFSGIPKKFHFSMQNPMFEGDCFYGMIENFDLFADDDAELKKLVKTYIHLNKSGFEFVKNQKNIIEIETENYIFISDKSNNDITQIINSFIDVETFKKVVQKRFPNAKLTRKKEQNKIDYNLKFNDIEIYHYNLDVLKQMFKKLYTHLKKPIILTSTIMEEKSKKIRRYYCEIENNTIVLKEKKINKFLDNFNKTGAIQLQLNF